MQMNRPSSRTASPLSQPDSTPELTAAPAPKRGAGRPRAFDRDAALEVALDLFWRQGFDCASTTLLTAAMGISQPSLYAAFGSKEALYREALALYVARYGHTMQALLDEGQTARASFSAVLNAAARQFSDKRHAPGCMVATSGLQGEPANQALYDHVAGRRQAGERSMAKRLEAARLAGELPADTDTATLAGYFAMVIQGMAVQARDGASATRLKRMAQMAMAAWPAQPN
jgi:AcrR family transcriptional regulator